MFETYQKECKQSKFDAKEVSYFLNGGKKNYDDLQQKYQAVRRIKAHWDPNLFNKDRVQLIKQAIRQLPKMASTIDPKDQQSMGASSMIDQFDIPGSIHFTMFMVNINLMGTQTQRKVFLDKCSTYQIIGCYAQTELGHGSDVQSLQTTATYDMQKEEFVINTPNIEAAKYWPGDMALFANWALVYARCIIKGKDNGIQGFLVPLRDQNGKHLPGVETGDIGPKWGFLTKDNGYMILTNIRIPRKNMLRRYVKIQNGILIKKGNQKLSYATMMVTRRYLSAYSTRVYAQAIAIAGKYSFARKQFKDDKKQEIPIINYQLQQNKLISCFAEHFAVQIGAMKTAKMTQLNIQKVNNDDDSLMKQTHNCLCLVKALYTEYCLRGSEICRLACGGHGFSHYSGIPHVIQQFSPMVTLEGENTVLYLQLARYVMKAYSKSISKKKPLGESLKYLQSSEELMTTKCQVNNAEGWNSQAVELLLAQSVVSLIQSCSERLMTDENQKKAWDFNAGIRLQQVAHSHAVYWTYSSFLEAVKNFQCSKASKSVLTEVCLLYGINSLLSKLQPLVENQLLSPSQLTTLQEKKELLLKSLRANFANLIESLGIPKIYERSALTYGNIYKNMFELAKQSETNKQMSPAVEIIKRGITNTRPKL